MSRKAGDGDAPAAGPFAGGSRYTLDFNRPRRCRDHPGAVPGRSSGGAGSPTPNRFQVTQLDAPPTAAEDPAVARWPSAPTSTAEAVRRLPGGPPAAARRRPRTCSSTAWRTSAGWSPARPAEGHRGDRPELADHHRLPLVPLQVGRLRRWRRSSPWSTTC